MYVRRPDQARQGIKIPENYSGHAFRGPAVYGDMPPPTRLDTPPSERKETTVPQAVEQVEGEAITDEAVIKTNEATSSVTEALPVSQKAPQTEQKRPSILASLLPSSLASPDHFPFGHGFGGEELLIMAMMLLVLFSGKEENEADHELLLLLGLLLFAG